MAPGDGVKADTGAIREYGNNVLAALSAAQGSPGFNTGGAVAKAEAQVSASFKGGSLRDDQNPSPHAARAMNFGYVGAMGVARKFWNETYPECVSRADTFRTQMANGLNTLGRGGQYCASQLEGSDGLNAEAITKTVLRKDKD